MFWQIISHTPAWVWVVLAAGTLAGLLALRQRRLSLWLALGLPVLLLALSISGLVAIVPKQPVAGLVWLLTMVGAAALGWLRWPPRVVDYRHPRFTIELAGSLVTLVSFLVIFGTRYAYTVISVIDPGLAADPVITSALVGVSGLMSGLTIGRAIALATGFVANKGADT